MSRPPSSSACRRNDSRTRRFRRFRAEALRQCFLDMASPSLARSFPFSLDKTVNKLSRLLFALANTKEYEAASGKRCDLLKRYAGRASAVELVPESTPIEPSLSGVFLTEVFAARIL
jgi:hypothetical protein